MFNCFFILGRAQITFFYAFRRFAKPKNTTDHAKKYFIDVYININLKKILWIQILHRTINKLQI